MLSWIASFFRPAESPSVRDIEAAYEPKVHTTKKASVPVGGRTYNFVLGYLNGTNGRPSSWVGGIRDFFANSTLSVGVSPNANKTVTPARPGQQTTEMVELSLTASDRPLPAPKPTRAAETTKISTQSLAQRRRNRSPLPTPPITPSPSECNIASYTITDFIAYSPYVLRVNHNYQPVAAISEKWLDDHGVHPSERKKAGFEACNFGLLTAMCYPDADYERFRVLCDYINCLFAFDDLTDEGGLRKDGNGTRKASDIIMNALWNPYCYETEFRCGQVFSSFWSRALETGCSAGTQRRFLEYTDLYVQAIHEQVLNRAVDHIPDVEAFVRLRRDTGALKMCFAMGEYGLNIDLPDEVFECPGIRIMEDCANDVVVLSNDIYSYNIEQAQGDTCNIIEVAMKHRNLSVQEAMDYAGELVKGRIDLYTSTKARLPSWGPRVDADVQRYLRVCEDWMTGGFYWSLESKRYFGDKVDEVRRTLRVELLEKEAPRGQEVIPDLDRA